MEQVAQSIQLRVVVLKGDRLYGDLIRRQIWDVWPDAVVSVFQKGLEALAEIQEAVPDLFVTGVTIEDMDGLEHLEPFHDSPLPILVVTGRTDSRTFDMLRRVRFTGIYDAPAEGQDHLAAAMRQVARGRGYVSPSLLPFLKAPKNVTLDALTAKEHMVLSVIGDGSDNNQASDRLGMAPYTVGTHRKRIMGKLGLHHQGELMRYALRHGYVVVVREAVYHPGFQRQLKLSDTGGGEKPSAGRETPAQSRLAVATR